ncbi:alpha/beta hydrolase-fold protein [Formosa sp. 3Alg 14/1]|uniref:alpha/beta hydrolase-fold protein n=1 Tax=Formosa sp. 3Alg 14/1 TaxID=3382190 RepID=UPI0039BDCDA8
MKKLKLLIVLFLLSFSSYSQNTISIGESEIFHSEILNEDRKLEIYLPKSYGKSDKIYPVLYLLDSFYNFSHCVGSVEYLFLNQLIPEMIIVGIRNTRRNRDLTPYSPEIDKKQRERLGLTGGADKFIDFLDKELIPHIEQTYRAAPYRIIVGHSLGGLFNVYTFLKKPELFNSYITISPSLWYSNKLISEEFENVFSDSIEPNRNFYLTLANENSGSMRGNVLKLSGEFENYINTHKEANLRFKYEPMPEESHGSIGLPSIYFGLRFIFTPVKYKIPKTKEEITLQGGPDKVIEKSINFFEQQSKIYGFELTNEYSLKDLGYTFLKIEEYKKYAIEVFKLRTKDHPESFDAYSDLASAYEELGEWKKAKYNYEQALRLIKKTGDPEWEFYQLDLDNLEKKIKEKKKE